MLFLLPEAEGQARKGIGITAGANLSRIHAANSQIRLPDGSAADINEDFDWLAGAQIGFTATPLVWGDRFSLNTGLSYIQRGATALFFDPTTPEKQEGQMRLQYLSVPVLARFYAVPMLFLEAGPQAAYLLDAHSRIKGQTERFDLKRTIDNDLDLGLLAGVGIYLHPRLSISAQYYHGLSDLASFQYTDVNGEPVGDSIWRNRSLQLNIAVNIL